MMTLRTLAVAAILLASPALAQHAGHPAPAPTAAEAPSSKAFREANMKMHKDMDVVFTGDADVDFVRGMIPHHLGAVEMARIELQYGKDPEIKKLASEIIAAQEKEIAMMKAFLARKGVKQ